MEEKMRLNDEFNSLFEPIPEPKMKLYVHEEMFTSNFFDTEEELIEYSEYRKNIDFGYNITYITEYIGNYAGRKDVVRHTYQNGKIILCTMLDEEVDAIYNPVRSQENGEHVWEYAYGGLFEEYVAFKERGIIFEGDVYAKIEEAREFYTKWFYDFEKFMKNEDMSRTLEKKEDN